jgi:two-component system cell cycle sensor histidine kinase/response regulator CckA
MPDSHDFLPDADEVAITPASALKGKRGRSLDGVQLGFWVCLAVAGAAGGMALTWRGISGPAGVVLIVALGAMGLLLALWTMRGAGRKLGLFPERGAAEAAVQASRKLLWLEALEEPALITDRGGAPQTANPAYLKLATLPMDASENGHAPSVDRLFGAHPGMAAPIYRLSKAVKTGVSRTEMLPAILMGDSASPVQFEACVAPLGAGRALWRLRRIEGSMASKGTGSVDSRALYMEDAPIGFFSARRDGRIVYYNQALRQMLGLADEPNGLRLEDIMRPEGLKLMRREVRGAQSQRADVIMRARDGVEMPAQLLTSWTGKGPDALTRSILYVQSPAEASLRRAPPAGASAAEGGFSSAQDDTMFADAPFGVVRLDGEGVEHAVMLDANRSLVDLTGGRAQPGGRFADLFVADQGPGALAEQLGKALDGGVNLRLAGERQKSVDVFIALDRHGRPSAAYVIDMTEKNQLEQRLAQSEKLQAIGKLAGEIAHDFNNLLQGIILNVNKLQTRHPPGDPTFVELKAIIEFSSRGAELVRTLLAYSRKQVFRQETLDVTDVVSAYYVLLRDILDARVALDIVHGRDLPKIRADKMQIETVLTNLCTNARDAMIEKKGGGHLTIRTSRVDASAARNDRFFLAPDGEYVLIEVIDDGAGIPTEILENIFQPFFTTKEAGAGTGLGLATVYGIVKQSGGFIYPISKVGQGTTFKILLPAYVGEAEEPARDPVFEKPLTPTGLNPPKPKDDGLAGRGRILLVEDEEGVRGIAVQLLGNLGYSVMEACDGEEALQIIKDNAGGIDLLISDVVMPGMDGPALLRAARPWLKNTRIMFISGYAERDLAKMLEEERSISFLPKPFTLKQLAEQVKSELQQAA